MTDQTMRWEAEGGSDDLIAEAIGLAKAEGWTPFRSDVEREEAQPFAVCLSCFDEAEEAGAVDEDDRRKLVASLGRGSAFACDCPIHAAKGGDAFPVDPAMLQAVASVNRLWLTAAAAPPLKQWDAMAAYNDAFEAACQTFGRDFLNALEV